MKLKIKKLKPRNPFVIIVMRKGVRKHKKKSKLKEEDLLRLYG